MAFAHDVRAQGLIDLSIGYPADDTPTNVKNAGSTAIHRGHTRYTPTQGILPLRDAIKRKLNRENGIEVSDDQVTVTPGVTSAILFAYLALLNPGDEVLIPDPYFPPYKDLATIIGAQPVLVNTFPDFELTAERIAEYITPRTRAVVVNTPNNPTGTVYDEKELRKIARLAKEKNLVVISDEIYEHFVYTKEHFSIGKIYPNTLTLNGVSKAYAMTGWRIGYIAGPAEIIAAINELQQYVIFSSSSIGQHAAAEAMQQPPKRLRSKYEKKAALVRQRLGRTYSVRGCEGAYYAFMPVPGGTDDLEFLDRAIEAGVLVLPGRAFSSRKDYFRISYATKDKLLSKALDSLAQLR